MEYLGLFIGLTIGALAGVLAVRFAMKTRLSAATVQADHLAKELIASQDEIAALKTECSVHRENTVRLETSLDHERRTAAESLKQERQTGQERLEAAAKVAEERIEAERRTSMEKQALLEKAEKVLSDKFKALSSDALQNNAKSFLDMATSKLDTANAQAKGDLEKRQLAVEALVKPIGDTLSNVKKQMDEIEKSRKQDLGGLNQQVKMLLDSEANLRAETSNLVKALRRPQVRGRWGEVQLRRVVEFAGMVEHCDFVEQASVAGDNGQVRPDMIVNLPGDKIAVVDAKTPIDAYLSAIESEEETYRSDFITDHVRQIKTQITGLANKRYWDQFETTPEFVVMFLPGEGILNAALERDPNLMEFGFNKQVLITTPLTLIALLRSMAYDWRNEILRENSLEISRMGLEMYDRLATLSKHFTDVGKSLNSSVKFYNKTVGSLESRVLTSARRFKELGVGATKSIAEPQTIDNRAKAITAPELTNPLKPAQEDSAENN